jgi:hypothetical protein
MTEIGNILIGLAIPCAAIGVALMMAMVGALKARGHKINWALLRLYVPMYVGQYREVTIRESGRPGPLFYPFVVSMNSALLLAVLGLVLELR